MATVVAKSSFVGSPEEMEKYGGQIPTHLKDREDKMSEAEKQAFGGKINAGTELEVSDKRAKELADLGLTVGSEEAEKGAKAEAKEKRQSLSGIQQVQKEKTETKNIPSAKKK